ncbi:MAG: hypothetical protein QOE58_3615 [Actinomycetota bacterium]|nr:hypothetical protein [Actinomycetota bacterium]
MGDGRAAHSPPRRGVMAAVVVGLLVVAALVVIGRGGDERPAMLARPVASPEPAPASSSTPAAVGPTTAVGGVPMGYARSAAGAEAAGIGFLRLDQALVAMTVEDAAEAKAVIASAAAVDVLVAEVRAELEKLRTGYPGGTTAFRIGVLATRVSPASDDRVRVEIWHVGVVSPPGAAPYEEWRTQRYDLVWERDDWRVEAESSMPGPRPLPLPRVGTPVQGELEEALAGFGPPGASR